MSRERWDEALPLGRWLEAVASPQPLPAGGRVASITGAFAAALVEKIARIVLRSPALVASHDAAEDVAARAAALRPLLLGLGEADDRAYAAVLSAHRPAAGEAPSAPLRDAELAAARVQRRLLELCGEVAQQAAWLHQQVDAPLQADLATAHHLALAAAQAARGNVEMDLRNLAGDEEAAKVRREADAALSRALQAPGA
jgi:formiminotetrahydrofolate cyclodeaminase